jgi:hypothetical protein
LFLISLGVLQSSDAASAARQVYVCDMATDTLDGSFKSVLPAAQRALEQDDWQIDPEHSRGGRLVTRWKPFHDRLMRFAMGNAVARCQVEVRPLDESRTIVSFRAGIATEGDLKTSPAFPLAQAAYRKAVKNYYRDLRHELNQDSTTLGRAAPQDEAEERSGAR